MRNRDTSTEETNTEINVKKIVQGESELPIGDELVIPYGCKSTSVILDSTGLMA